MNGKQLNGMLIPTKNLNYNTRNTDKIALFYTKHNFFQKKKNFYPRLLNGKSQILIFEVPLVLMFSKIISYSLPDHLQKVCLISKTAKESNIQPTILCLGLSYLHEHKFKHSFQDTLNPFCLYGLDVEASTHFFLYCLLFINQR